MFPEIPDHFSVVLAYPSVFPPIANASVASPQPPKADRSAFNAVVIVYVDIIKFDHFSVVATTELVAVNPPYAKAAEVVPQPPK